ncbi:hypothetical protein JMJ77_0002319 [Colletotrichum scovillei]|uniref:Uncharacterized protein n=1 Tax=Colletotrichum scovillei TaxID=1209932 RepID=A0A9P7R7N2_9PEZI|nr:hypothetical protein JMJ77_0002319 [Colletotrichum scovillei]KAG7070739.1 hypothetical protein JMJ76_0001985 [Colletotrichum scovillei]KAG7078979.1 hypothetical protein JMJ78_0002641 [Colletotrichum scovillei]
MLRAAPETTLSTQISPCRTAGPSTLQTVIPLQGMAAKATYLRWTPNSASRIPSNGIQCLSPHSSLTKPRQIVSRCRDPMRRRKAPGRN